MKANELRIGNIVYLTDKEKCWEILDGHEIDECENNPFTKPIPLTKEILENVGFKSSISNPKIWLLRIGDTNLMLRDGEVWSYSGPISLPIIHLHQLQNLHFALTGKELEFKHPITLHTAP